MIKNPTPAECDMARKILYSMEAHGNTHSSAYISQQETVRICKIREEKEWTT